MVAVPALHPGVAGVGGGLEGGDDGGGCTAATETSKQAAAWRADAMSTSAIGGEHECMEAQQAGRASQRAGRARSLSVPQNGLYPPSERYF